MNDKEFLTYFETLSKGDVKAQTEASEKIVKTLMALSHAPASSTTGNQQKAKPSKTYGKAGSHLLPDVDYTLKRLIQGTTTETLGIQVAFAIPLRSILQNFEEIDIVKYINCVAEECNVKNAVKKSERNHFILAKILCLRALVLSGRLERYASTAADPQQIYIEVYDDIVLVMENHPWARAACAEVLQASVEADSSKGSKSLKTRVNLLFNKLKGFLKYNDPDVLALLVSLYDVSRRNKIEVSFKNLLDSKILNFENLSGFFKAAIDIFPKETALARGVINYIYLHLEEAEEEKGSKNEKSNRELWDSFWKFFLKNFTQQENSNVKSYFQVLSLLKAFLKHPNFSLESLGVIMHESLIQLWCRNLNVLNENTQKIAAKSEKAIRDHIKSALERGITNEERKALFEFLCLSKLRDGFRFTHKSELAKLLFFQALSEEDLTKYYKFLKKQLSALPAAKMFYLNELYIFAHFCIDRLAEKQYISICCFFLQESDRKRIKSHLQQNTMDEEDDDLGILIDRKTKKMEAVISDYFYSLLNHAMKRVGVKTETKSNVKGLCSDSQPWLLKVFEEAINQEKKSKEGDEDPESKRGRIKRKKFLNLCHEIQAKFLEKLNEQKQGNKDNKLGKLNAKKLLAFESLVLSVCIQSFQYPDECFENLDEFASIYKEMLSYYSGLEANKGAESEKTLKKKRKLNDGTESSTSQHSKMFMEVLVDVFISLLTKSHVFLRDSVKSCFKQFVDLVDPSILGTLTEVITRDTEEYLEDMVDDDD